MKKTIILGMVALAGLMFDACTKAKDGAPGAQGPAGVNGTNGTDGIDGNANVIGTNTVTISSWTANGASWTANMTAAGITSDVVNTGTVQVFIQYGSSWWALPDINGVNSTSYGFSVGTISLLNSNSDGSTPPNPGAQVFRAVIIPSQAMITNPNVDYKNYEAIKTAFNLED
ncbi:MAG: hypothetical protein WAQ28_01035 [Bacteroidia bacterium]